jgi:predicted ATPase
MNIDIKLAKHSLQQVQNFEYKVGDCLFNSRAYLLNYLISSKLIQKYIICYLQKCLIIGTL